LAQCQSLSEHSRSCLHLGTMFRTLAVFSVCVAARGNYVETGTCVLNGGQAVSDAADAGIYAWAAAQRCGKGKANDIKCATDVMSAVESANMMINVILEIVDQCQEIKSHAPHVALAASKLTAAFEGMGAATAQVIRQCDNQVAKDNGYISDDTMLANSKAATAGPPATAEVKAGDVLWQGGRQAECAIDMKNSLAQVFKAATAIAAAKEKCGIDGNEKKCAYNAVGIISALGGMARFIQESVGKCSPAGTKFTGNYPMHCAAAISRSAQATTRFIAASIELDDEIHNGGEEPTQKPPTQGQVTPAPQSTVVQPVYETDSGKEDGSPFALPQRLYAQEIIDAARAARPTHAPAPMPLLNIGLTAMLPITAIAAFIAGMKLRKSTDPEESYRQSYDAMYVDTTAAVEA